MLGSGILGEGSRKLYQSGWRFRHIGSLLVNAPHGADGDHISGTHTVATGQGFTHQAEGFSPQHRLTEHKLGGGSGNLSRKNHGWREHNSPEHMQEERFLWWALNQLYPEPWHRIFVMGWGCDVCPDCKVFWPSKHRCIGPERIGGRGLCFMCD